MLFKVLGTALIAAVLCSLLYTVFRVVVVGNYWANAPLFLTVVVALIVPVLGIWAAYRLLRAIWSKAK